MRPSTFHTPGLPTDVMRIIESCERAMRTKPKQEDVPKGKKPRAPKRRGGRARKEDD